MTQDEFIDKWLVGYESREQKEEFVIEMMADLASLQSKGKTKEGVIWTDADIQEAFAYGGMKSNGKPAYNVLTWFPYFKQERIDNAMEEYAQSHANKDGWVRVEDRLPELGQKVLAIQDPTLTATREPLFAFYDGKDFIPPAPTYYADFEIAKSKWAYITHWMPLPPKPQI